MSVVVSKKHIGSKIAAIRKKKGWTQGFLASKLNMARPAVTQIESGGRNIDILEMIKISEIFGLTVDEIVSKEMPAVIVKSLPAPNIKSKLKIRISKPSFNPDKFKNVLLYILEHCAGKPNFNQTVLEKILYFIDFNYYEVFEDQLTGITYRKLAIGPVPLELDDVINQMVTDGVLFRINAKFNDIDTTRHFPTHKADLTVLKASEKEVIDKVIEQMSDWYPAMIEDYSQNDMPCLATKEGEQINYDLSFYRELPYSVRVYDDEK